MQLNNDSLTLSATDLATFMGCRHATYLTKREKLGEIKKPFYQNTLLDLLKERGEAHEKNFLDYLATEKKEVISLSREANAADLLQAMTSGVEIIYQAPLSQPNWQGFADFLVRVDKPSKLGDFSYEVMDAKLARETRGETILQLCIYSEIVESIQGVAPDYAHVLTPGSTEFEDFRLAEYTAYYRLVRDDFAVEVQTIENKESYPVPCQKCDRCDWFGRCESQWRSDDHLTFVAGIHKSQRLELSEHSITTLQQLAETPVPLTFQPRQGSVESLTRLREQARLQLKARVQEDETPISELIDPVLDIEQPQGLYNLPSPSEGDVFFDIEGARYVGDEGFEYLLGYAVKNPDGAMQYVSLLANNPAEERAIFDDFMQRMAAQREAHPDMHIFHYHSYETSALKRLTCRYAMHQELLDELLREKRFVDLHRIVKHSVICGIERYSIKDLEPFFEFNRDIDLRDAGDARHQLELWAETGSISEFDETKVDRVIGYNRDDCLATEGLRNWLEDIRSIQIDAGFDIPRPEIPSPEPNPDLSAELALLRELAEDLRTNLPEDLEAWQQEDHAKWVLSHLLEFYRREANAKYWEYFRLAELDGQELIDEQSSLGVLTLVHEQEGEWTFSFPPQETTLRVDDSLGHKKTGVGKLQAIDESGLQLVIKSSKDLSHIDSVFKDDSQFARMSKPLAAAMTRLAQKVLAADPLELDELVEWQLLLKSPVRLSDGEFDGSHVDDELAMAREILPKLQSSLFSIQGPPGSGKTYTGSRLIVDLIRQGKKVGITSQSHKAIRNLLDEVAAYGQSEGLSPKLLQAVKDKSDASDLIDEIKGNPNAAARFIRDEYDLLAGTAWVFARPEIEKTLDYLFIDEAGQFSLAHTLVAAQSASNLVLLGDPQQLDQVIQASHPDGIATSALGYILGDEKTIGTKDGLFLHETWRMHPDICSYISEMFYEDRLGANECTHQQKIIHDAFPQQAGLWFVPVEHEGNTNASVQEADVIAKLIADLEQGQWCNQTGEIKDLSRGDILVVTPYNAQVALLSQRVLNVAIGSVDRFQGQEAAVVIVSMAASSAEDAPRGMEFLYSLNRLNVAASRARCATFLVASPSLAYAECKSPKQMRLANGIARYVEVANRYG